jgi:hypothetical protein
LALHLQLRVAQKEQVLAACFWKGRKSLWGLNMGNLQRIAVPSAVGAAGASFQRVDARPDQLGKTPGV